MLVFENKGELDMRFMQTFGMSAKDNKSPIGFFGTGLKYAIAILLREGLDVVMYSGNTEYRFAKEECNIRGKDFQLIKMSCLRKGGGKGSEEWMQLPFTTELGKHWELWQAYRELFSNTQDEGGTVTLVNRAPIGHQGTTRIVVWGLDNVHLKADEFILRSQPLYSLGNVVVHHKHLDEDTGKAHGGIFYKNILVHQPKEKMVFRYNFTGHLDLTEDRTMKYWWAASSLIMEKVIKSNERQPIQDIVCADEDTFEGRFNYKDAEGFEPSEIFLTVMETYGRTKARPSAYSFYREHCLRNLRNVPLLPLSEEQRFALQEAKNFLCNTIWVDKYAIVLTDMLEKNDLFLAQGDNIYLSEKAFDKECKTTLPEILLDAFLKLEYGSGAGSTLIREYLSAKNPEFIFPEQVVKDNTTMEEIF